MLTLFTDTHLVEQVAHARGAHAHKHLHKLRRIQRQERHARLGHEHIASRDCWQRSTCSVPSRETWSCLAVRSEDDADRLPLQSSRCSLQRCIDWGMGEYAAGKSVSLTIYAHDFFAQNQSHASHCIEWYQVISNGIRRRADVHRPLHVQSANCPTSPATARASSVFPVPGGPHRSTPRGMRAPLARKRCGFRKKSTTSISSTCGPHASGSLQSGQHADTCACHYSWYTRTAHGL